MLTPDSIDTRGKLRVGIDAGLLGTGRGNGMPMLAAPDHDDGKE